MRQPASPPFNMKEKDISGVFADGGSSSYPINPAYATVSPLLGSFMAYRVGTTTTLLRGQLAGQFIDPSELLRNQSSRPYRASAAVPTADTVSAADIAETTDIADHAENAKTAAVKRLNRVLDSDRESVQNVSQPRLAAQKA